MIGQLPHSHADARAIPVSITIAEAGRTEAVAGISEPVPEPRISAVEVRPVEWTVKRAIETISAPSAAPATITAPTTAPTAVAAPTEATESSIASSPAPVPAMKSVPHQLNGRAGFVAIRDAINRRADIQRRIVG